MSDAVILHLPHLRDGGGAKNFAAAMLVAALLHVGLAYYMAHPPHISTGGGAGGGAAAQLDMENVNFRDENIAPEQGPVDMSYRPEVATLPDVTNNGGGGDGTPGGPADMSNAKMDESGLEMSAPGEGGDVLKIGGPTKGLDDLLALPKAGGGGKGKPGVGYRIKTYPPTVPFFKVEVKPQPVNLPVPEYPATVRDAGIEGTSVVEALLDLDGSVMDARVLKSSGNQMLDAAAVEAALKAKFTPAKQRDKAVRVWISLPYRFTLK
jgi:TonB family protein